MIVFDISVVGRYGVLMLFARHLLVMIYGKVSPIYLPRVFMVCVAGASGLRTFGVPVTPLGRPRPLVAAASGILMDVCLGIKQASMSYLEADRSNVESHEPSWYILHYLPHSLLNLSIG